MPYMNLASILTEGFITYIVHLILDGPVSATQCFNGIWSSLLSAQTGDAIVDLTTQQLTLVKTLANPSDDLLPTSPIEIGAECRTRGSRPSFFTPVPWFS